MIENKGMLGFDEQITLAELYRNIGEFKKCILLLECFNAPDSVKKHIEKISDEAKKQNKATIILNEI